MEYYVERAEHLHKHLVEHGIECYFEDCNETKFIVTAHIHTAVEMLYITEGCFIIYSNGEQKQVFPGDLVLIPSNTVHSIFHFSSNGRYLVMKVTVNLLERIFKGESNIVCIQPFFTSHDILSTIFSEALIPEDIKKLLNNIIFECEHMPPIAVPMQKAYIFMLVALLYRNYFMAYAQNTNVGMEISKDMRKRIYQSIEYINENYATDLKANDCAKMINISYSHYAKLFRAVTGKTFKEYLIDVRLAKAHIALLVTDLPIVEIALSYGFNNSSYFTSEFRKHYGVTPTEIRKSSAGLTKNKY